MVFFIILKRIKVLIFFTITNSNTNYKNRIFHFHFPL